MRSLFVLVLLLMTALYAETQEEAQFLSYLEDYVRQHGGKTMVLFTNNRDNLSFYTKRGYEVFHEYEITHNGQTMGSWSLKKSL